LVAAIYNIGWGIWSALNPDWLFRFSGLSPSNHPEIFACLGMVVGVYGLLYAEVARAPERGWPIAAVGLLGKVLGPIGWAVLVIRGAWPLRTAVLCLTNDFVWWIPFLLFLVDAWPSFARETFADDICIPHQDDTEGGERGPRPCTPGHHS